MASDKEEIQSVKKPEDNILQIIDPATEEPFYFSFYTGMGMNIRNLIQDRDELAEEAHSLLDEISSFKEEKEWKYYEDSMDVLDEIEQELVKKDPDEDKISKLEEKLESLSKQVPDKYSDVFDEYTKVEEKYNEISLDIACMILKPCNVKFVEVEGDEDTEEIAVFDSKRNVDNKKDHIKRFFEDAQDYNYVIGFFLRLSRDFTKSQKEPRFKVM